MAAGAILTGMAAVDHLPKVFPGAAVSEEAAPQRT
jgi:hypothetical protein